MIINCRCSTEGGSVVDNDFILDQGPERDFFTRAVMCTCTRAEAEVAAVCTCRG